MKGEAMNSRDISIECWSRKWPRLKTDLRKLDFVVTHEETVSLSADTPEPARVRATATYLLPGKDDIMDVVRPLDFGAIEGLGFIMDCWSHHHNEDVDIATPKTDWRVGMPVRDRFAPRTGVVIAVHPSGTAGIDCKDGVLAIRRSDSVVVIDGADQWVTA